MPIRNLVLCGAILASVGVLVWWFQAREPAARGDLPASVAPEGARMADPAGPSAARDAVTPDAGEAASRPAGMSVPLGQSYDRTAGPPQLDTRHPGDGAASAAGPAPMSSDNLRRVERAIAELRAHDAQLDDLHTLLEHEGRDPEWSDAAEALLADFVRLHGAGYTDLEVRAPRCSATVCELAVMARPGMDTEVPSANWQRLLGLLYGQDWFVREFVEPRMSMTVHDDRPVYITTLMRAERGG